MNTVLQSGELANSTVSGVSKPTKSTEYPMISNVQPPELRRNQTTFEEYKEIDNSLRLPIHKLKQEIRDI